MRIEKDSFNVKIVRPFRMRYHLIYDPILLVKLFFLFRKNKYDIVHTHTTKAGILGRIAARIAGTPIIIHGLHGNSLEVSDNKIIHIFKIFLKNITGRFTDAFISVSSNVSEKYLKYKIGERKKYFTVKSGISLNKFMQIKKVLVLPK